MLPESLLALRRRHRRNDVGNHSRQPRHQTRQHDIQGRFSFQLQSLRCELFQLDAISSFVPVVLRRETFKRCRCLLATKATAWAHVSMSLEHQSARRYERDVDRATHSKRMNIVAGAEQQHPIEVVPTEQATQATHRGTGKHDVQEITHLITTAVAGPTCVHAAKAHVHAPRSLI